MREIVLDTETTGLDPFAGHKIVEIACLELKNHVPTGQFLHRYVNPERDMPAEAFAVHGLSQDFLKDHPLFTHLLDDFLDFIDDSPLVIHNASFDMKFLNFETRLIKPDYNFSNKIIDTLAIARKRHPGSPVSLDALCKRYNIDNSARTKHGALLDCELLASVYLELLGGRQPDLLGKTKNLLEDDRPKAPKPFKQARSFDIPQDEQEKHAHFLKEKFKNPLWDELGSKS